VEVSVGLLPSFWNCRCILNVYAVFPPKVKVKISLLQAVEAPRVARGRGSHII
jgi:hypothetical protein